MLKIIAVLILIYVFFKALGMIFRTVIGGSSDKSRGARYSSTQSNRRTGREGDINVDHSPNKRKDYDGGEYVDYEEVD